MAISIVNRTTFSSMATVSPLAITIPATTAGNTLLIMTLNPSTDVVGQAPWLGAVRMQAPRARRGSSIAVLANIAGGQTTVSYLTAGNIVPSTGVIYELSPCIAHNNYDNAPTVGASESGPTVTEISNAAYFANISQDSSGGSYNSVSGPWTLDYAISPIPVSGSGIGSVAYILNTSGAKTPTWSVTGGDIRCASCAIGLLEALTVTSVNPSSGDIAGGTPVTVAGTNFATGAAVTFGGSAATSVVVVSSTSITCVTPAHSAGAVDVVVTNTDSNSGTLTNGFTYTSAPPVVPRGVLSLNKALFVANGSDEAIITATVVDSNTGLPVEGVTVSLSQSGSAVVSPSSQDTDANGHAIFAATDLVAESVTFTASSTATFSNTVTAQFIYGQRAGGAGQGTVYSSRGPVIAGANIWICTQPADVSSIPPSPLATIYSDAEATQETTQPIVADGLGMYSAFTGQGLYTVVVEKDGSQQTYRDQEAGLPTAAFHRLNWWTKSNLGPAIPGAQVFVVNNTYPHVPSLLSQSTPTPTPLIQLYSDSAGTVPVTQPLITDTFGYAAAYLPAGAYTVLVYFNGALQSTFPDQSVGGEYAGTLARYDGWVRNALGVAQSQAKVIVCTQPCTVPSRLVPDFPTPLADIYSDVDGHVPVTQSLSYDSNGNPVIDSITTDGNGYFSFYSAPNEPLTVAVYNSQNVLLYSLADQVL